MWVSTRAQYGMRALVEIALSSEPTSLKVVSDRQNISQHYLEQIVAVLRRAGIVESTRGAYGGYRVAKPLNEINALEATEHVEGRGHVGRRGAHGGYRIARPLEQVTALEVVELMEGSLAPVACIEDTEACEHTGHCATETLWTRVDAAGLARVGQRVLVDLLAEWEEQGDRQALAQLETVSLRLGPDGTRTWLDRCASARAAWFGHPSWQPPMGDRVKRLIGLDTNASRAELADWCSDDQFDCRTLRDIADAYHAWGAPSAKAFIQAIDDWLALEPAARANQAAGLADALFTKEGQLKWLKNISKAAPGIDATGDSLLESLTFIASRLALGDRVPDAVSVATTVAPATGWPFAVTVPRMRDVVSCALTAAGAMSATAATPAKSMLRM